MCPKCRKDNVSEYYVDRRQDRNWDCYTLQQALNEYSVVRDFAHPPFRHRGTSKRLSSGHRMRAARDCRLGFVKLATFPPSRAIGYGFALIAIDNAAFAYQSSNLEILDCLTVLPSTPFVFSDRELGALRPTFGGA